MSRVNAVRRTDYFMTDKNPSQAPESTAIELAADGALQRVAAAALWAAGVSWLVPMMGLQMLMHRVVGPERMDGLERIYTRGQIALTGSRWRAVVDPAVDPKRAYLFFQNHVNHLDHCTMYAATPHFKQGVELAAHFNYPVYGHFMRSRGTIPVDTASVSGTKMLMTRMRDEIAKGHSLLVFPEGTRTLTGWVGDFQPGVFRIAISTGAPIVPVTVTGMYRVMRKGSWLIRPGHDVTVYCDAPIETQGLKPKDIPALMTQVRETMMARLRDYWAQSSG
jgi:1-acyl-sn-glycerol-3-phosphate acyltransferase